VCITERERALHHLSLPLKQEHSPSLPLERGGVKAGRGRGQRLAGTHLQEVILNVAVEGAAQPHRVVLPQLVGLQVEAELRPAVLQTQAERRPHLDKHGRQLLDVEDVCGR